MRITERKENVIFVEFERPYALDEAEEFLGEFFHLAMNVWSLDELAKTMNHMECLLTDAYDAYHAIYVHRVCKIAPAPDNIVQFPARRKAA